MSEALIALAYLGISSIVGWLTSDAMSHSADKQARKEQLDDRNYQNRIDQSMNESQNGADFNNANI